jgi:D-glycero-alpha-D-manno-heptose-7-phosphate kinase
VIIHAQAPVRVDFAGGWSDVPRFADAQGGVVASAALALYAHVECRLGGRQIRLHAEDLAVRFVAAGPTELVYDGTLDLHKAALNMLPVTGGLELLTRCDVPPGSGLGASGALDVALIATLARARRERYDATELAELGFALEATELELAGGRQDQYAAALGGWHELVFGSGAVDVRAIPAPPHRRRDLERHLVVAYTGQSHFSSQTHERVWEAYRAGRPDVVDALRQLRDLGGAAAAALRTADWKELARVVDQNWQAQRRLDATIATPQVEQVERAARAAGAWGLKATGAGAGGCLLILASPDAVPAVRDAVRAQGATLLPAVFDAEGARVWEEQEPGDA